MNVKSRVMLSAAVLAALLASGEEIRVADCVKDPKLDFWAASDVEMPELANEIALHLYASHPMYICISLARKDLFDQRHPSTQGGSG